MQALNQVASSPLTQEETRQAEASGIALKHLLSTAKRKTKQIGLRASIEGADGEQADLILSGETISLISKMLTELGHGKQVVILSSENEVTTQQAADFLRVSRPYFVKLLESGRIPYRLVGPRRRVLLRDLLAYQEQEEAARHKGLDELVAESQRLGMY